MPSSGSTTLPPNYQTPSFPSLYWLVGPAHFVDPKFLYRVTDVWRFTLYWTIIIFEAIHLLAALYGVIIVWWGGRYIKRQGKGGLKKIKVLWAVPVVYGLVAGVEAMLAGSVVGLM